MLLSRIQEKRLQWKAEWKDHPAGEKSFLLNTTTMGKYDMKDASQSRSKLYRSECTASLEKDVCTLCVHSLHNLQRLSIVL